MKIATVSAIKDPSGTHMFGYSAAIPAASRPVRAPLIWRPVAPMSAMLALPSTADHTMCASWLRNPTNDGTVIRLTFPPLTQDRRKELIKVARERAEEGRIAVRNVRRHAKDELEKLEHAGDISEDDLQRAEKDLQKLTDRFVTDIDQIQGHKEQELMEV